MAAAYFAGLATLPLLVIVLNKLLPRQVDSQCTFCKHTKRFNSWAEAEEYAKQHIATCEKHPYCQLLNSNKGEI
jgi:hypothetical protein